MSDEARKGQLEEARLARAEATLCALLAKGFFRPSEAFACEVAGGEYLRSLLEVVDAGSDGRLASALEGIRQAGEALPRERGAARLELEVDYNRLFVGPGQLLAPPYESYYRSMPESGGRGTICGAPMLNVKSFYQRYQVSLPEEFIDYPDHVAFELEFLSLLAEREAECLEAGDAQGAEAFARGADLFREEHLGMWIARFASDVEAGAGTALYRSIASLTAAALA